MSQIEEMAPAASGEDKLAAAVRRSKEAWHRLGLRLRSITPDALARFLLVAGVLGVLSWVLWRSLVPLMPGYDQVQVVDSFDQRRKKQEFLEHAFPNPNFVPCMAHNSSDPLEFTEDMVSE